jgi:hypothetical protein
MPEGTGPGRFAQGLELALRSGAAPFVLGLRWAASRGAQHRGVPSPRRGLAFSSKRALDEVFLATEIFSASFIPLRERRRVVREMAAALEFFEARGWLDDPRSYHLNPPPLTQVCGQELRTAGIGYQHLLFESGYTPHAGEPGRARWLTYENNCSAHAWVLEHPGQARPWLMCIPGYRMGHPLIDFMGFRARWLHRTLGLNVASPVMPLHGPRRVGRRGGDGFFSGDFVDTVHAQAQAVWDVRRLAGWLRNAREAPAVGAYGVSLGGYTVALLASLERNLDCVISGIPATDFARLIRQHAPRLLLRAAEAGGLDFDEVGRLLRVVSPLALPPLPPRQRRFVYAGIGDRLASPDHARDLWHHWEKPRVAWYHGGHVSFLWERDVKEFLREALGASGLLRIGP